ncbi:MAG: site-specific integrase, partial [SAR202 cluster bacterium]|nr:site-specific integrase [SAR202 cluster bacterium]
VDIVVAFPKVSTRSDQAHEALLTDYAVNGRRSLNHARRRVNLGLLPWFQGRRMAHITPDDVQLYVEQRQRGGAANATINRELAALKRMFSLAIKRGRLFYGPYIPLLHENNIRQGFFEREQFEALRGHLPAELRGLVTLAYYTGWRMQSEVFPLRWPQVDRQVGTIRLEPGTTKNSDGRTFAYAEIGELRQAIETQWREHQSLRQSEIICPWVFHRNGRPIKSLTRAWRAACKAAGCPGRVPHDFRRTAVRNMERAGVPRKVAMTLVGHRTEAMYRRYDIVTDGDLHDAAAKIESAATVTKTVTINRSAAG